MPLDLDDAKRPKKRWVPFDGHLTGVEILIQFFGTQDTQRFRNRLQSEGIIKVTKDDPLNVNPGREAAFFLEIAKKYILDWRVAEGFPPDTIKSDEHPNGGAPYTAQKMADVLAAYPSAFSLVMRSVGDENGFFGPGVNGSMPS